MAGSRRPAPRGDKRVLFWGHQLPRDLGFVAAARRAERAASLAGAELPLASLLAGVAAEERADARGRDDQERASPDAATSRSCHQQSKRETRHRYTLVIGAVQRPYSRLVKPMSTQKKQFETILRHDDPIVRDHTVHGVRIMPGVTFIDVVVRALSAVGIDAVDCELKKIVFHEAVAVAPDLDREVRITIEDGQGSSKVSVASRGLGPTGPLSDDFDLNISCEVATKPAAASSRVDVEALRAGAVEVLDVDRIYAIARSMRIEHGPFMKTEGRVYRGADYVLAEVSLSEEGVRHGD